MKDAQMYTKSKRSHTKELHLQNSKQGNVKKS